VYLVIDYSIFDSLVQQPLAYARGTATTAVRERLNVQTENALNRRAKILAGDCASRIFCPGDQVSAASVSERRFLLMEPHVTNRGADLRDRVGAAIGSVRGSPTRPHR
jgi:hypothetical protein